MVDLLAREVLVLIVHLVAGNLSFVWVHPSGVFFNLFSALSDLPTPPTDRVFISSVSATPTL